MGLEVSVNLSPEVLSVLGLPENCSADEAKNCIENLHFKPYLFCNSEAGRLCIGLNIDDTYPQASISLTPKGSTSEIDVMLADVPKENKGDISLLVYDDPFSEDYTFKKTLLRENVINAMKSIDDYDMSIDKNSKPRGVSR